MLAELILSFLLAPKAPGSWLVGREEGAAQVPVPYRQIPRQAGPDVVGVGRVRLLQDQAPRISQQHHPARRAEAKDLQEVRWREAEGQLHLQERSVAQSKSNEDFIAQLVKQTYWRVVRILSRRALQTTFKFFRYLSNEIRPCIDCSLLTWPWTWCLTEMRKKWNKTFGGTETNTVCSKNYKVNVTECVLLRILLLMNPSTPVLCWKANPARIRWCQFLKWNVQFSLVEVFGNLNSWNVVETSIRIEQQSLTQVSFEFWL